MKNEYGVTAIPISSVQNGWLILDTYGSILWSFEGDKAEAEAECNRLTGRATRLELHAAFKRLYGH